MRGAGARTSIAAWLAAGAALAGGCSLVAGGRGSAPPPEPELRIWVAPVVWTAGADRHVDFAIENDTPRTIAIAEPDPANARVAIYPGPDNLRVCGVEPRTGGAGRAGTRRRIELAPGDRIAVRVELRESCAGMPPGDYRYEVDYRSPPVDGGKAFSGALATRYGELSVGSAPGEQVECLPAPRAGRRPPRR